MTTEHSSVSAMDFGIGYVSCDIKFIKDKKHGKTTKKIIKKILTKADDCPLLEQYVLTANNIQEIKKAMKWSFDPVLDRPDIYGFDYLEDLNERRIRDAELLATAVKNCSMSNGKTFLKIGTANGMGTILMSRNIEMGGGGGMFTL